MPACGAHEPQTTVASRAFAAAAATPLIRLANPACQHHTMRLKALTGDHQPELVEPAELRSGQGKRR